MQTIFGHFKNKYQEEKLGSERASALLGGLIRRLPQIYDKIMTDYRVNDKKQEKKKAQADERKLIEMKGRTTKMGTLLQSLKDGTYRDKLDESSDEDHSEEEYDSEEDEDQRAIRLAK